MLGIARGAIDLEMPSSGGTTDAQLIAAAKSDAEVPLNRSIPNLIRTSLTCDRPTYSQVSRALDRAAARVTALALASAARREIAEIAEIDKICDYDAHHQLARRAARESAVRVLGYDFMTVGCH